jgi:hypothetical protein
MDIMIGGRGSGRTTSLIRAAANRNGTIVVHCQTERLRVQREARQMGVQINPPAIYGELLGTASRHSVIRSPLHIDNVEKLLKRVVSSRDIETIVLLNDEHHVLCDPDPIEVMEV